MSLNIFNNKEFKSLSKNKAIKLLGKSYKHISDKGYRSFTRAAIEYLRFTLITKDLRKQLNQRFPSNELFQTSFHQERKDLQKSTTFKERDVYILSDQNVSNKTLKFARRISSTTELSDESVANGVFYVYYLCDSDALPEISRITKCGGKYIPHMDPLKTSYRFVDRSTLNALRKTLDKNTTQFHQCINLQENICEALNITRHLSGDYVEIGVFRGSSAIIALNYIDELKSKGDINPLRRGWLLDTYEGFNYHDSKNSADAIWWGTHKLDGRIENMKFITETFSGVNTPFEMVISNICTDSLPDKITEIAVANVDVDIYEATAESLKKVSPLVVKGGIIICEDPASTPTLYGALLAMEEFLESQEGKKYIKIFKGSQYFLIKQQ